MTLAAAPLIVGLVAFVALLTVGGADIAAAAVPLGTVVFGLAAASSVGVLVLPRLSVRSSSLRRTVLAAGITAMIITGVAVTVSSAAVMLEPLQLSVLVLIFLFGASLGVILEFSLARSLSDDLQRLGATARRIGRGDYAARAEVDRSDEIGEAGRVIDRMALELQTMEGERAVAQASRQAFLAAVGHDLRTPLAAMRAAAEALEDGLAPEPARYYAAMRHDLDALTGLVDDLFLLARLEGGALRFSRVTVDVSELSDEAVEALEPIARLKGVRVRLDTSGHVYASGGPAELSRTLRNLLDNAIRHAPAGSEVTVLVRDQDGPLVCVIDRGPGLSGRDA
ncbi:MAG: HAMP domain-containing histidine kinase [Chloroflexi bacterium]|nr:HAMP domain-containing histidine kinase [Chloroflexota bacterium]